MADQVFKVALVGYGLSTNVFQIPFLSLIPQFKLYAIVQRHPKPNDDAEKEQPGVTVYRSSDDMLRDPEIDIVMIGTASHTHFDLCNQALKAGKHVLCEKPFTLTTREADELIAFATQKRLLLTVFHMCTASPYVNNGSESWSNMLGLSDRRWDSDFRTVSSLIAKGTLGRVVEFESHFDVHSPLPRAGWDTTWRTQAGTGSGVVYDLGSHLIDQALVLFGMPQKVTGFLYHQRAGGPKYGDHDSMTVLLHYTEALLVTIKASVMNVEEERLRFWVRGEKGTYKKYHLDVQEAQIVDGRVMPGNPEFGVEPASYHGKIFVETMLCQPRDVSKRLLSHIVHDEADVWTSGILSTISEGGQPKSERFPTEIPPTYVAFYRQLADALAGQASVPVTPESARDVVRIIELAIESERSGITVDFRC